MVPFAQSSRTGKILDFTRVKSEQWLPRGGKAIRREFIVMEQVRTFWMTGIF
jgi:hypothetical protein